MPDCAKSKWSRGFCGTHYRQFSRGCLDESGAQLRPIKTHRSPGTPAPICKVEGCGRPVHGLGLCTTHKSQQWLGILDREGNQVREKKNTRGSHRTVTKKGYVRLYLPENRRADMNGYVWEHIVVMEENLGRRLMPQELVHHRNGIRGDNSPGNLELRTTATHEPGHLVDVALAIETLELSVALWDRSQLRSILNRAPVDLQEVIPDPLGGLQAGLMRKIQAAKEGEPVCRIPHCVGPARAPKGMCWGHYFRERRGISMKKGT